MAHSGGSGDAWTAKGGALLDLTDEVLEIVFSSIGSACELFESSAPKLEWQKDDDATRFFPNRAMMPLASTCVRLHAIFHRYVRVIFVRGELRTPAAHRGYVEHVRGALARFPNVHSLVIMDVDRAEESIKNWSSQLSRPDAVAEAVAAIEKPLSVYLLEGCPPDRHTRIMSITFFISGTVRFHDEDLNTWAGIPCSSRKAYIADAMHWFSNFPALDVVECGPWVYGLSSQIAALRPPIPHGRDIFTVSLSSLQMITMFAFCTSIRSLSFFNNDDDFGYGKHLDWSQMAGFIALENLTLVNCGEYERRDLDLAHESLSWAPMNRLSFLMLDNCLIPSADLLASLPASLDCVHVPRTEANDLPPCWLKHGDRLIRS